MRRSTLEPIGINGTGLTSPLAGGSLANVVVDLAGSGESGPGWRLSRVGGRGRCVPVNGIRFGLALPGIGGLQCGACSLIGLGWGMANWRQQSWHGNARLDGADFGCEFSAESLVRSCWCCPGRPRRHHWLKRAGLISGSRATFEARVLATAAGAAGRPGGAPQPVAGAC